MWRALVIGMSLLLAAGKAGAVEIQGTVRDSAGGTATVVTESEFLPNVGDKVEFYFLSGTSEEVSLVSGRVSRAGEDSIEVEIMETTGELLKDRLARIHSDKPVKRAAAPPGATPPATAADRGMFEYDTDRPGSDYRSFDLTGPDPRLCAAQCMQEAECAAWTYVKPGVQGPSPRCWLKDRVPQAVAAEFAVSGVKAD
jgi:hypothetical protein